MAVSLLANALVVVAPAAVPAAGGWESVGEMPTGAGPGRVALRPGLGEPRGPDSLAVDKTGAIYVLDGVERAIEVLHKGRHVRTIDLSFAVDPGDVAPAPDGTLYVLDMGHEPGAVFHLSADGSLIHTAYFAAGLDLDSVSGLTVSGGGDVWIRIGGSAQISLADAVAGVRRRTPGQIAPGGLRPVEIRQTGARLRVATGAQSIPVSFLGPSGAVQLLGEDGTGALHLEAVDLVDGPTAAGEITVRRYGQNGDLLGVVRFDPPAAWGYVPRTRFLTMGGDGQVYALVPRPRSVQVLRARYGRTYESRFAEFQEMAWREFSAESRPEGSTPATPAAPANPPAGPVGPARPARPTPRPITVNEAVHRSQEMIRLYWYFKPDRRTPVTATLRPPDWLATSGPGWKRGIPYDWGGMDSPDTSTQQQLWSTFMAAIRQGRYPGNVESSTCCYQPGTVGLDCSGFVTAVWGYPNKLGTYGLRDDRAVTKVITRSDFGPMDAAVTYGHALLYYWRDASGVYTAESTTANKDRAQNAYLSWSFMAMRGYAFRRYAHMLPAPAPGCGGDTARSCVSGSGTVLPR